MSMQEVGPDGPDTGALGFLVGVGPVGLIGAGVDGKNTFDCFLFFRYAFKSCQNVIK